MFKWSKDLKIIFFTALIVFFIVSLYTLAITKITNQLFKQKTELDQTKQQLKSLQQQFYKYLSFAHFEPNPVEKEYISLFKSYCREDWDWNCIRNPFHKEIETLSRYFNPSDSDKILYPLDTKIEEIPKTEEMISTLRIVFKDNLSVILKMPLRKIFMLIADLKTYRKEVAEKIGDTPEKFFKSKLEKRMGMNEAELRAYRKHQWEEIIECYQAKNT